MNRDKEKIIKNITSIIAGILGSIISSLAGFPMPLGTFVLAVYLFHGIFNQNPFELSEEELRDHIRKAVELEERYRRKLEDLERIKKRMERKEIAVEDSSSLDRRIEQIKELVKLARAKKNIAETIIIVRENIEVFKKLFGDKNFNKLISDVGYLKEKIDEALKKEGIEEIDLEEVSEYLKNVIPLIIKEPEKYVEKTEVKKEEIPPKSEEKPVDILRELLTSGTVDQWIELIKKAISENTKIKLPPGRYQEKKGYKNLLKSIYAVEYDVDILKKVIDDRVLIRFTEYLETLKEGKAIEVDVQSSDLNYISDMLEKISDEIEEKVENGQKIYIYKFAPNSEQIAIEKRIVKDQVTGRAIKAIFKKIT